MMMVEVEVEVEAVVLHSKESQLYESVNVEENLMVCQDVQKNNGSHFTGQSGIRPDGMNENEKVARKNESSAFGN